jgi:NADH:ubiquinone oxidoreductase subunit 2 (subunit N)
MFSDKILNEINTLNFEDLLWVIFVITAIINMIGNYNEKEFLKTNNQIYKNKSNKLFEFTLIITFLIYIYFFSRNYQAYKNSTEEEKSLYTIKLLGSSFLIAGIICLIYFQYNQSSFIGSPAI